MSDERGSAWRVITDAADRLLSAPPTVPGAPHNKGAAGDYPPRRGGEVLDGQGVSRRQGTTRAPVRDRRLKLRQRRHNSTQAGIRCLGEQALAALKD
ncbi:hypothetical protein [Streptomyces sp. MH60]|uniref:hypothetical protein n=1 Tax=Streptomyces sp. MH60 TaxID=1940758 RepID=UPI001056F109|nr:hypothetical protein [Streptomyces sp. MH60]